MNAPFRARVLKPCYVIKAHEKVKKISLFKILTRYQQRWDIELKQESRKNWMSDIFAIERHPRSINMQGLPELYMYRFSDNHTFNYIEGTCRYSYVFSEFTSYNIDYNYAAVLQISRYEEIIFAWQVHVGAQDNCTGLPFSFASHNVILLTNNDVALFKITHLQSRTPT